MPRSHKNLAQIFCPQNLDSAMNGLNGHFIHIYVLTDQLFNIFSLPEARNTHSVQIIADQYVLLDDRGEDNISPRVNRGRPAKNWDSFYAEIAIRVHLGTVPDKQEAFISEMQEWCLRNWGESVGRSTILEKVSPIYKKIKNA